MRPLIAASAVISLCAVAAAQKQPAGDPPTPGVYNPSLGVAGDSDAASVEKNPAGLGELQSWSLSALHTEVGDGGTVNGRGTALFAATPLPYLRAFVVGAGLQILRPPRAFAFSDEQKLSLALAWRPTPGVSIGLSYAHLWSQRAPVSAGIDTLDVSAALRLGRWLGVALVVRDVTAPVLAGLPLQRVYEPEVAVRPLGNSRLEIGVAARFGERRGDVDPRFRVWFTPYTGVHIKTDVEWRRDIDLDGQPENDVRVALGLALDFERVGVSTFALFGRDQGATTGHGATVALRVSGERYPAVYKPRGYLEKVELSGETVGRRLLTTLLRLRQLERDKTCAGVVVVMGELGGSFAAAEELRAALLRLRAAKKRVFAFGAGASTKDYYVASAAERIFLDPAGGVKLLGVSHTGYFLKGTGELIGVKADFVRIAEYKSAPESFTESAPSPPARAQREALADGTFAHLTAALAEGRGVSPAVATAWFEHALFTPPEAARARVVDEVVSADDLEGALSKQLGGAAVALRAAPERVARGESWSLPRVAILDIEGDLVDGKSYNIPLVDMRMVGLKSLLPALLEAVQDSRVAAVVVRVNSPGGSALAADLLAREIERLRVYKPIVCSLGDVAASGGYYLAAPCSRVFASPSTVTGSIGIYTGKFDLSGLLGKLGAHLELTERGRHAAVDSLFRPYSDDERARILEELRYHYGRFVATVARGRKLSEARVDELGRGRVFLGDVARRQGLVDELGGFSDAVAAAMQLAGLRADAPVELTFAPDEPTLLGQLASLLGIEVKADTKASSTQAPLPDLLVHWLRDLPGSLLGAPSTPQARLDPLAP